MTYGTLHGHLANLHQYGKHDPKGKPLHEPGSAIYPDGHRDDEAYLWYGGRHRHVWDTILKPQHRMKIFIGECGYADAVFGGIAECSSDFMGYQDRLNNDPDVVAYAYWTLSGHGALGWELSSYDAALPAIAERLRST